MPSGTAKLNAHLAVVEEGLRQTAEWIQARGVDASAAAKYSR